MNIIKRIWTRLTSDNLTPPFDSFSFEERMELLISVLKDSPLLLGELLPIEVIISIATVFAKERLATCSLNEFVDFTFIAIERAKQNK